MKNKMMKKITKIVTVATVSAMVMGACVGCGSSADVANTETEEATTGDSASTEVTPYEFETFDGATVVIDESNIVSKEECEEPLEWTGLPQDAEQLAPGRDCILFGDATNYYVEDATNKLVIVAKKDASASAEATSYEFETFDGATVVIDDSNIVSKEECEEPLEWTGLPQDAEQLAPGRDCILFGDATNYYVEDATNKLVIVATKEASASEEGGVQSPFVADMEKYDSILSTLTADQYYAFAAVGEGEDILLVTDGVYDNLDGNMATIDAKVYAVANDGQVFEAGSVWSDGTAYPIAVADDKLIFGGNHRMAMATVVDGSVVVTEEYFEEFDEEGNATYSVMIDNEETKLDDNSKLMEMFDKYNNATVINFNQAQGNGEAASDAAVEE